MDPTPLPLPSKRRPQGAQPASRLPNLTTRDKRQQQELHRRQHSGRIRLAKDSNEILRVPKRLETKDRPSLEDDGNARHFTVANVGRNGTLYLKPSRITPPHFAQLPATPPHIPDGPEEKRTNWSSARESAVSGTWTPRASAIRNPSSNHAVPVPPPSMGNGRQRRQMRSRSFSTIDDSMRSPTFDSSDFHFLLNGKDATRRPRSSADLASGLLDLSIPHYRLGTPRFSDRGTAYLHNSVYSTSEGVRSSVFSRAEYDKVFPAPPGQEHGRNFVSRASTTSRYLHPSHATLTPSRTPPTPTGSPTGSVHPGIYGRIESNINDPAFVRYSSTTGKIIAATPARLIAQITSPLFLDYELLADFFLTFRDFLSRRDLLEYLLARMQWALATDNDAGRIVRVRTFVAIRHWILNYFVDDFFTDMPFRQRFCTLVNELAQGLRQRSDGGGTDIKVVGELKKCWRRTCATFWPVPDALDSSADPDIFPGQEQGTPTFGVSATSLPLSLERQGSRPNLDFRRSSQIRLPVQLGRSEDVTSIPHLAFAKEVQFQTASIPTSPMSEQSLTVLSCSVPFLKHAMLMKEDCFSVRPAIPQTHPAPPDRAAKFAHGHKRSGSFTDALRDKRPPLPSVQPESVDVNSLPSMTFTGGLVRGLLLQPSPSKVNIVIPISPTGGTEQSSVGGTDNAYVQDRQQQNAGMKKIVGDFRRVLGNRKGFHESPASSHRSTSSSDSKHSGNTAQQERSAWQQLCGPARIDRLGEKIGDSYKEAFQDTSEQPVAVMMASDVADRHEELPTNTTEAHPRRVPTNLNRLDSHVTTGSRSIVIFDDTGVPGTPASKGPLPSSNSWSSNKSPRPPFRSAQDVLEGSEMNEIYSESGSPTAVASEIQHPVSIDFPAHNLLLPPVSPLADSAHGGYMMDSIQARKSSNVHPSALDIQPFRHQLRRRPGGDLKAADHVQDLEPVLRLRTGDSYSTFSQAMTSATASHDLSGTHFSGQYFNGSKLQDPYSQGRLKDSLELLPTHSSQPNMRLSFQKQVSHIAHLPEHDGGVEDALAKLEGKTSNHGTNGSSALDLDENTLFSVVADQQSQSARSQMANSGIIEDAQAPAKGSLVQSQGTDRQGASILQIAGSEDGANPIAAAQALDADIAVSPVFIGRKKLPLRGVEVAYDSGKPIQYTEQVVNQEASERWNGEHDLSTPKGSFLLDDNESLSDISTEIAEDHSGDESTGVRSFFFDDTLENEAVAGRSFRHPPTPPSSADPALHTLEQSPAPSSKALQQRRTLKAASSTPKLLPSTHSLRPGEPERQGILRRVRTSPCQEKTAHLPFILAFDSDVIAEQMTIIEKDALDEVDWKDLTALNWQQTPCNNRNWVDFLKKDTNGIDIVIGRFNLAVKWAVSECLLTETPSERAKCITKYIHIAAHCLELRNYASMYQITLALLSSDLARLRQTWALVPPTEKHTLARFEKLCQPQRNFHQLRSEMETAAAGSGCIPFIGLYTHDLMFNAQKPSSVDPPPPGREKLINFERYQTAANIIKSLLRLIEASSNYIFRPHPEVLSRCLWLAALEDNDLTTRSKTLEE